jgi:hypothetical protein
MPAATLTMRLHLDRFRIIAMEMAGPKDRWQVLQIAEKVSAVRGDGAGANARAVIGITTALPP